MVAFTGKYHAILGRPCYAKFMAVPNYIYLKLKMPGPKGVITVGVNYQHAYQCDVECCEHAALVVAKSDMEAYKAEVGLDVPDARRPSESFKPDADSKEVPLNPEEPQGKKLRIGTTITPK